MNKKLNRTKLSRQVKSKRLIDLSIDLKTAAIQIGTSAATLWRVENEKNPDVDTLANICDWLDEPIDSFFMTIKPEKNGKGKRL